MQHVLQDAACVTRSSMLPAPTEDAADRLLPAAVMHVYVFVCIKSMAAALLVVSLHSVTHDYGMTVGASSTYKKGCCRFVLAPCEGGMQGWQDGTSRSDRIIRCMYREQEPKFGRVLLRSNQQCWWCRRHPANGPLQKLLWLHCGSGVLPLLAGKGPLSTLLLLHCGCDPLLSFSLALA